MLDAETHTGIPPGDHEVVGGVQRADSGEAVELRADAGVARAAERDARRVEHPLGVRLDPLDRGPHGVGWCRDRDAHLHRHAHATAARNSAAARSGGTVFTRMPVACSKPATTARRGITSTYQWYGCAPGGAVRTTTL